MIRLLTLTLVLFVVSSCNKDNSEITASGTVYKYTEIEGEKANLEADLIDYMIPAKGVLVSLSHLNEPSLAINCCWGTSEPSMIRLAYGIDAGLTDELGHYELQGELNSNQEDDNLFVSALGTHINLVDGSERLDNRYFSIEDIYTLQHININIEVQTENEDDHLELFLYSRFDKDGIITRNHLFESVYENEVILRKAKRSIIENLNYDYELVVNGSESILGHFYSGDQFDRRRLLIKI